MKKSSKKGFTLVELVIVIAVIAILAAVLIPTFSGVQERAKESAALQACEGEYKLYITANAKTLTGDENFVIINGKYAFEVKNGQIDTTVKKASDYTTIGKVDLTKNKVKSAVATGTTAPTITGDTQPTTWYADITTKTVTTTFVSGTTYYYAASEAIEGQQNDVMIYNK